MLLSENAHEYSKADALAVDALFKRLAERGHRIRLQRQTVNIESSGGGLLIEERKDSEILPSNGDKRPDARGEETE